MGSHTTDILNCLGHISIGPSVRFHFEALAGWNAKNDDEGFIRILTASREDAALCYRLARPQLMI